MDLSAVGSLELKPLTGYWFRALNFAHLKTRLSTEQTIRSKSRFSAASTIKPGYRILYLAENPQIAGYEIGSLYGPPDDPVPRPQLSLLLLSLKIQLSMTVDLCDEDLQSQLGTNSQELTGNWLNSPGIAPTQHLGRALFQRKKLEGFLYPSSRVGGRNLVVFPDKLHKNSSIIFQNDWLRKTERLI